MVLVLVLFYFRCKDCFVFLFVYVKVYGGWDILVLKIYGKKVVIVYEGLVCRKKFWRS